MPSKNKSKAQKKAAKAPTKEIVKINTRYAPATSVGHLGGKRGKAAFYESIVDPFNTFGARIPDMVTTPSIPIHLVQKNSFTSISTGDFGCVYEVGFRFAGSNGYKTLATATSGAYTWNSAVSYSGNSSVNAMAGSTRVVSAGVFMRVDQPPNNIQGRIAFCYIPSTPLFNSGSNSATNSPFEPSSWAAASSQPYFIDVPASERLVKGVYVPVDFTSLAYISTGAGTSAYQWGSLVVLGIGLGSGASIDTTFVQNLEAIPLAGNPGATATSSGVVQAYASPSWASPDALSETANLVGADYGLAIRQSAKDDVLGTSIRSRPAFSITESLGPWIERIGEGAGAALGGIFGGPAGAAAGLGYGKLAAKGVRTLLRALG